MTTRGRARAFGLLALALAAGCGCGLATAAPPPTTRAARFVRGDVLTHAHAHHEGSRLMQEQEGSSSPAAFVVSYPAAARPAVRAKLLALPGVLLVSPVPAAPPQQQHPHRGELDEERHELVRATPAQVVELQQAFAPGVVTASLLPAHVKVSDGAEAVLREVTSSSKMSSHGALPLSAGGAAQMRAGGLQSFLTSDSPDGRTMLVLSLTATPFTTSKAAMEGGAELQAARAEAAAWEREVVVGLAAALSTPPGDACAPSVANRADVYGTLQVTVCALHAPRAVEWLAAQRSMIWVDVVRKVQVHNLNAAVAMQVGPQSAPATSSVNVATKLPYWAAGIDGTGEVVGVTDTGLDMDSCYFWDPNFADYQTNSANLKAIKSRTSSGREYSYFSGGDQHRKVQSYYYSFGNSIDDTGHGTHVAGTVAGSSFGFDAAANPDIATGIAPGARISVFDMQNSELADSSGGAAVSQPGDIASMWDVMHQQGVRVVTNSWGSNDNSYADVCKLVDAFARLRDMTIVFASGNFGYLDKPTFGTVVAPATCKNVISVAASENFRPRSLQATTLLDGNGNQRSVDAAAFSAELGMALTAPDDPGRVSLIQHMLLNVNYAKWVNNPGLFASFAAGSVVQVVLASPSDACSALTNTGISDKIVLYYQGSCNFVNAGRNIIAAGAKGGLFMNAQGSTTLQIGQGNDLQDNTPFASILYNSVLENLANANQAISVTIKSNVPQSNIADFSSYGPAWQGSQSVRIKPDITAPGMMLSAETDRAFTGAKDACLVSEKQGTSMAAPAVAGAVALVRQYFKDGFYPTGTKNANNGFDPEASLVRAVLLGGAEAMAGISIRSGLSLGKTPNSEEGYGFLSLKRSLPLAGNDPWVMEVFRGNSLAAEGESKTFTASAQTGPLIVTLAWLDLPGTPGTNPILVNDLDLKVVSPDGSQTYMGNGVSSGDRQNNNERVTIDSPVAGNYVVTVTAHSLNTQEGAQPYSLVVMGGIDSTSVEAQPSSPPSPPPPPAAPAATSPVAPIDEAEAPGTRATSQFGIRFNLKDPATALALGDDESAEFLAFRKGVEGTLEAQLPSGGEADIIPPLLISVPTGTSRALLQNPTATADFRLTAPKGTSQSDFDVSVGQVQNKVNSDATLFSSTAGITSASTTTSSPSPSPASTPTSGAQRPAHNALLGLLAAALGAALLL